MELLVGNGHAVVNVPVDWLAFQVSPFLDGGFLGEVLF